MGSINRRIMVQAGPGTYSRLYLKNNYNKRTGVLAQVVKCLPDKHKALSSNAVPPKKTQKNKKPITQFKKKNTTHTTEAPACIFNNPFLPER
jgi:hypothetical protein